MHSTYKVIAYRRQDREALVTRKLPLPLFLLRIGSSNLATLTLHTLPLTI